MKENGTTAAFLSPDIHGWRVTTAGSAGRTAPSLAEAIADLPANAALELDLPCQSVVIERHKLPSTERSELAGMLQLQLEKTLPFPVEDVTHGFEILGQSETESTVLTVAAPYAQLEELCAPLRERGRVPGKITLHALRVAAACPAVETILALWPEQEQTVAAIISGGKLTWAQPINGLAADAVLAELPGLLLGAELEGVSTDFTKIRVATGCAELEAPLAAHFGKPVGQLGALPAASGALDLLPDAWQAEARRRERTDKLKHNLLVAAVVYLLVLAGAFIYLAWLKRQAFNAQTEYDAMKPRFAGIEKQMARWDSLAPAVDPNRYVVEVLHQLAKTWQGNEKLQFTTLTFSPREWVLKGEATTDARFDFVQRLKRNKELEGFDLQFPPEQPLKDDKVSFTITGKPRV
jgi:hypothetical protein